MCIFILIKLNAEQNSFPGRIYFFIPVRIYQQLLAQQNFSSIIHVSINRLLSSATRIHQSVTH